LHALADFVRWAHAEIVAEWRNFERQLGIESIVVLYLSGIGAGGGGSGGDPQPAKATSTKTGPQRREANIIINVRLT
jgi:hypothetical protein